MSEQGGVVPEESPETETPEAPAPKTPEAEALDLVPGGAKSAIEAILMIADRAVSEEEFAEALQTSVRKAARALESLQEDYEGRGEMGAEPRGMELRRVAGGWRLYSRAEYRPWVGRFILEGQTARLSQAALETLAVIAYRQPVSRGRVSSIRGVSVDGVIRTLKTRGLIEESEQTGESGAVLFQTTPLFLERIGLDSLDELPKISPYLPGAEDVGEYEH